MVVFVNSDVEDLARLPTTQSIGFEVCIATDWIKHCSMDQDTEYPNGNVVSVADTCV